MTQRKRKIYEEINIKKINKYKDILSQKISTFKHIRAHKNKQIYGWYAKKKI